MSLLDQFDDKGDPEITILVTCYNEEEFIVEAIDNVVEAMRIVGKTYEIIVIDDVSTDGSVETVRSYVEDHPDVPIVIRVNPMNQGLASNYIDGAFLGSGKYYRLCCGDASEPVDALVRIFRLIGMADMIVPYQIQSEVVGKSSGRRLVSRLFTAFVNLISGYSLKYYNGSAVQLRFNVMRWHPSSYGFGFQADIVTRLLDEGVSFVQVPSFGVDRKGSGSTAISMRNILSVGHTLLELVFRRARKVLYGKTFKRAREILLEK
jgi:glycosyltransferase involved in cell wall biosynthesis